MWEKTGGSPETEVACQLDEPPDGRDHHTLGDQMEYWLFQDRPWMESQGPAKGLSDDPILNWCFSWFLLDFNTLKGVGQKHVLAGGLKHHYIRSQQRHWPIRRNLLAGWVSPGSPACAVMVNPITPLLCRTWSHLKRLPIMLTCMIALQYSKHLLMTGIRVPKLLTFNLCPKQGFKLRTPEANN